MFQVPVSTLEDTFNFGRTKATAVIACLISVSGLLPALSYISFSPNIGGIAFFDLYDLVFGTYMVLRYPVQFFQLLQLGSLTEQSSWSR